MSKPIPRSQILTILERRFDFQSARTVMVRVAKQCNLEDKEAFEGDELESFCAALEDSATSIASTAETIRQLAEAAEEAPQKAPEKAPKKKGASKK